MKHLDPSQRGRMIRSKSRGTYQSDPLPPGAYFSSRPKKVDPEELAKLVATLLAGGLVPERSPLLDQLAKTLK